MILKYRYSMMKFYIQAGYKKRKHLFRKQNVRSVQKYKSTSDNLQVLCKKKQNYSV